MEIKFKTILLLRENRIYECFLDETWLNEEFLNFISKVNEQLANAEIIKDSISVKAGFVNYKNTTLFIKRYNDRGFLYRLKYKIKTPRPQNALQTYVHMIKKNPEIPVATHICSVYMKQKFLKNFSSFSIQKAVEDTIPVAEIIERCKLSQSEQIKLLENLASVLACIHAVGVYHGDAKLTNFYFKKNNNDNICGIWDLDVAKIKDNLPKELREKDVARTAASFISLISKSSEQKKDINPIQILLNKYSEISGITIDESAIRNKINKFIK